MQCQARPFLRFLGCINLVTLPVHRERLRTYFLRTQVELNFQKSNSSGVKLQGSNFESSQTFWKIANLLKKSQTGEKWRKKFPGQILALIIIWFLWKFLKSFFFVWKIAAKKVRKLLCELQTSANPTSSPTTSQRLIRILFWGRCCSVGRNILLKKRPQNNQN